MKKIEISSEEWFYLKDLFEEMEYFIYNFNPVLEAENKEGYDEKGINLRWNNFLELKLLNIYNSIINTLTKHENSLFLAKYEMQYFDDFERKLYFLERFLTELYPDKEGILWGVNGIKHRFLKTDIWEWYSKPFENYLRPLFDLRIEILNEAVIICREEIEDEERVFNSFDSYSTA